MAPELCAEPLDSISEGRIDKNITRPVYLYVKDKSVLCMMRKGGALAWAPLGRNPYKV